MGLTAGHAANFSSALTPSSGLRVQGKLQTGDAGVQDSIARMNATENGHFRIALDMGYLTVSRSPRSTRSPATIRRAELIGGVFKTALGFVTEKAGKIGGAALDMYTDAIIKDVTDQVLNSGPNSQSAMKDAFYQLGFPSDPKTQQPYEGPAEADYGSTVSRIISY